MARPSSYSEEIANAILDRLADGESLRSICRDDDIPDRKTVRHWEDTIPDFAAKCGRAREHQGDAHVDRMDEVCASLERGDLPPDVARVLLSNMQWKASKLNRKRYGETIKQEITGEDGGPIQTKALSDTDLDARIAELAAKTGAAGAAAAARGKAPKARR